MARRYAPTGDKLSEHIIEAMAIIAEVDLDIAILSERLNESGLGGLAKYLRDKGAQLQQAKEHLRAAEAIRKGDSPRRQAALSREAGRRNRRSRK